MRVLRVDLRAALQASKNDFEMEKKRSNELADLLHQKTKQCVKIQVPPMSAINAPHSSSSILLLHIARFCGTRDER